MQLNSNLTLSAISWGIVANLITPMGDHQRIFSLQHQYNIKQTSEECKEIYQSGD